MSESSFNLVILAGVTLFLSLFTALWLWDFNTKAKGPIKKYYAILRMVKYGRVPTLCANHALTLIQRKGKMAVVDNMNCEICTNRSKLI